MSEEARLSVHRYFQEFGHEVGEAIYGELKKPGGMSRLLKKLGIPEEGDTANQYRLLIQYFRQLGTTEFMQIVGAKPMNFRIEVVNAPGRDDDARVRLGLNPVRGDRVLTDEETGELRKSGEIQAPKGPLPKTSTETQRKSKVTPVSSDALKLHTETPAKPVKKAMLTIDKSDTRQLRPRESSTSSPTTPAASGGASTEVPKAPTAPPVDYDGSQSPYDNVDEDGFPVGPLIPAPSPSPADVDKKSPSWDPDKPFDPTGEWPEVERRSGRERRRKPDRRSGLDTVFKNKRFGGDRRKKTERRRNWPKGGFDV